MEVKKRRRRGPPALGDLETSKAIATAIIETERKERAAKSAALKAQREAQRAGNASLGQEDEYPRA